jgi:hypothetical protein
MKTSSVPDQVTNTAAGFADELRDIKPPVDIPTFWFWVLAAVALAVLAVLVWAVWFVWKHRTSTPPLVPVLPPHERARQKLQAALDLIEQPKPFCVLVSDAVRLYLEERFAMRAPERTTEEFLVELGASDLLTSAQKGSLQAFLSACDLVKFARYEPGPAELQELHKSALRLVTETEPVQPESLESKMQETASERHTTNMTTPLKATSNGRTLAMVGTFLQLGPSIWIIAYVSVIFRLLALAGEVPHSTSQAGLAGVTELVRTVSGIYSKMLSIYGDALLLVLIGLVAGLVGLILLSVALVSFRYRAEWFFWFLVVYGVVLLGAFPCFGAAIGIFLIVYCLTKRREFFPQA